MSLSVAHAMNIDLIHNPTLGRIAEKVQAETPVDENDAMTMLTTTDIVELGLIADYVRRRVNGAKAYYGVNMNLNYTNVCELRCPLCAYSRDEGDADAFTLSLDEIEERVRHAVGFGIDEVHIVGGLNPALQLDYFIEMLRRIKREKPELYIVAFTATEYDYFARRSGMSIPELFRAMIDAGLGALPGGGAEIFDPGVRGRIAPRKISRARWLAVMREAHRAGLKTNATMLYNHIENPGHIADHLARIRELQNETGGFKTFVPLPFHAENTALAVEKQSTGFDDVRIYATARIFLHNIPHLKGLWMYLGEKLAQVMLHFGVDDIGATYHYEKVVHAAGAMTEDVGSEERLRRIIENAGMTPVRATAAY
jgi:aminodeoxyfutalosine synthase